MLYVWLRKFKLKYFTPDNILNACGMVNNTKSKWIREPCNRYYNSIDGKLRLYTWPPTYYISPVNCRSLVVWCSQPYDTTRGENRSSQFDPMFTYDISADLLSIELKYRCSELTAAHEVYSASTILERLNQPPPFQLRGGRKLFIFDINTEPHRTIRLNKVS